MTAFRARDVAPRATFAGIERQALCDLLDEVGPAVPTLCTGWNAADLTAHLVLRERRPEASIGILAKRFGGYTERVRQRILARHEYSRLVDLVRTAPPRWAPHRFVPRLDAAMNTVEFFVHSEDVRRAQRGWRARPISHEYEAELWRRLSGGARFLLRSAPVTVVLASPAGRLRGGSVRAGTTVTVHGPPSELLLFACGRQSHADVEFEGPEWAAAAVRDARFGI
ncbi:TIGR03085 family metal-binding protein [Phytohabitans sp. LJ34]|uniref:TIGR03085 family metal-binding protein n=1 Tax=Phytohabitans sp. LJ34 TaxID=3452217 RepID=UPI003F8BA691